VTGPGGTGGERCGSLRLDPRSGRSGRVARCRSSLSVINRRNGTEAQLIIDVDAAALPVMPGTTCNVGRSAKVYFQ